MVICPAICMIPAYPGFHEKRLLNNSCCCCCVICRSRTRDQEEVIAKLRRQLAEAETKIQQQAREFEAYKSQLRTKPEMQLQSDINVLTLEKVS